MKLNFGSRKIFFLPVVVDTFLIFGYNARVNMLQQLSRIERPPPKRKVGDSNSFWSAKKATHKGGFSLYLGALTPSASSCPAYPSQRRDSLLP